MAGDGSVSVPPSPFFSFDVDVISHLFRTGVVENPHLFYKICLYFANGIDLAITNKEVPSRCSDIPLLLKEVYKYKKEPSSEAAFVVLMISIKSACKAGWFSNKDADELEILTNEAMKGFSNPEDVDIGPSCALPYLSNILSRCNPQMKMEKILVSLGVKAGFGAYVSDFNVSRDTVTSQHEKICLFFTKMGNVNTSHLVTPPQIDLMLNGRTVEKGSNINTDTGPQLLNVTSMLEDGVNLIQAVGKFNGSYVIALATTSIITSSGNSESRDSNQQLAATAISGIKRYKTSWQISLKCPISRCRINTPVKGSLCKHLECFDRESYLKVNLKEPLWRCPICKLPAGATDLHVDQRFSKVLRESPVHVNSVFISKDGSWKPVPMRKDCLEKKVLSDILSVALEKAPVLPNGSSTTRENVKPNSPLSNIGHTPDPLQHHSTNQTIAVQIAQPSPRQGSDVSRPWISQQQSTSTGPNMLKTVVTPLAPSQDDRVGRMRGSLTGQAYDAALSRFMNPPIQPPQAPPQPTSLPRLSFVVPVHFPPPNKTETTDFTPHPTSAILRDRG